MIPVRARRQHFSYWERCNTRNGQSGVRLVTGVNERGRDGKWRVISIQRGSCVNRA